LAVGTRLGPYEIVSPLGAGGMGEVYRARDTRLERTVAVKVLPSHLSRTDEARQRFEREAKTISQLSHPHICALYDVGNQDGVEYLVMEYLEGETLAERLLKGPLPADQTLRFGIEIADALDKAHRQGIVHRDLKPGNVMLTKSGVKLLDFGLAKAVQPALPTSALTSLPTETPALTAEGTILGTFQYMAPEQLEGRDTDARTDIFAFGAVLYEMATGQKAFSGRSRASLIGAILKDEPPLISTVQPMTPPALDRIVRTCLAKDPEDRRQTARDVVLELRWITEGSQAGIAASLVPARRSRERLAWILAVLFGAGLAVTLSISLLRQPRASSERRAVKLSVLPPEKGTFFPGMIALSPDGSRLAFVAAGADGKNLLWIRPLDAMEARPLPGTERAYAPFWSPDGRFLAFFAEGKLKKIEASGGPPQILTSLTGTIGAGTVGRGGTWNREGVIVFAPNPGGPLVRILDTGGAIAPVTKLDASRQENSHRWPVFLPDGRRFFYFARSRQKENHAIFVGSLDSKETTLLMSGATNVLFSPGSPGGSRGDLLFERNGRLVTRRLDVSTLRFEGEPIPIAERIQASDPFTAAMFTVSETGVLAYGQGIHTGPLQLAWFDRSGKRLGSIDSPGYCLDINLSPDQKRVALDVVNFEVGGRELWQAELTRGLPSRLTLGDKQAMSPVWSPDGTRIAFSSNLQGGAPDLYEKPSRGVGKEEPLFHSDAAKLPVDWSADGRFLVFELRDPDSKVKLWVLPLSGDRKPFPLLQTLFNESLGAFSPDGRWIAYVSDESGRSEVYVQAFPISTAKWRVSTAGGTAPRWRRDGKEIFYLSSENKLMAVPVTAGPSFDAGIPVALFEVGTTPGVSIRHAYCVTSDGERFLVIRAAEPQETPPITVVLNWTADLKK
jgi:Tol biopolymer transport system component/predicted Ser/Thr protein kinase